MTRLALDPSTRRTNGGRVLVGGSPLRILRLTEAGARVVDAIAAGEPLPDTAACRDLVRRMTDAGIAHPRPEPGHLTPSEVTVVIPHRGGAAPLARTLDALGPAARVVVVDDGSPDPGEVAAASAARGAEVVRHEVAGGPAVARNSGWRRATTEVVAFVDSDCEPEPGWLDRLLAHLGDPLVVAVAPRVVARAAPTLPRWVAAYEAVRSPLDQGPLEAVVRPRSRVTYVPSAALVVRREALQRAHGFDEALRFGEDVDLVWRLVANGGRVRYDPSVAVSHGTRPTLAAGARQRFDYGTSAAPLARRHRRAVAPLAVSGWSAAVWGLAGAGRPRTAAAVAAATTALLAPRLEGLDRRWEEAVRLAGAGHLHAGRLAADALRRTWWPLTLSVAAAWPRCRPAVAAAFLVPPLADWVRARPPLDPLRFATLRILDDVAYGAGVWAGALRERSGAALVPDLTNWPGRRPAIEPAYTPRMDTNDTISPG